MPARRRQIWRPVLSKAPPVHPVGVWTPIAPAGLDMTGTYGSHWVQSSPSNPDWLFCCIDTFGVYRSKNRGVTWEKVGPFDNPTTVWIDPANHLHVYCTQGVRGSFQGFWESVDGGDTWAIPAGFVTVATAKNCYDVTMMAPNPADFSDVIVGCHSPWSGAGLSNAGIYRKQGATWTTIEPPAPTNPVGTVSLTFLYDPASGQGSPNDMLVATNGDGIYKSTDAGASFTKVSSLNAQHGGGQFFYAPDGKLYAGGVNYPMRSSDNGSTWASVGTSTLPNYGYFAVWKSGSYLYTGKSSGVIGGHSPEGLYRSLATDGLTWSAAPAPEDQLFVEGPFRGERNVAGNYDLMSNWFGGIHICPR